jgi:predicted amidophosphoribosyltransferase
MRQRHIPRLCQSCGGPMARQTETCWRCGTRWAAEDEPRTRLRLIRGGPPAVAAGVPLEPGARLRATTTRR